MPLRSCSVVIPTLNRPQELERCVRALASVDYPRFEVIIVDNSNGDHVARGLAEQWRATYLVEPRRGVSFARNLGAQAASGEIIACLDDDAVPEAGWLRALAAEFDDESVAAVAGPYLPLDHSGAPAGFYGGSERLVLDGTVPGWFEMAAFGGFARAGNMAIRRSALRRWRGFEPRLGRGTPLRAAEDDYAVLELIELGFRVIYTPDAVVRHAFPHLGEELAEHQRRFLVEKGLFVGFLLANSQYRREVLRYLTGRLGGKRVRHTSTATSRGISSVSEFAAGLKGLLLFASLQLTGGVPRGE